MGLPVLGLIDKLFDIGSEFITDKDKLIEFQFKTLEVKTEMTRTLLATQTIPWVDALIKVMVALKMFIRPVGGALMTAFGMYAHLKGIEIDVGMHALFDGALPAWGVSRHIEKKNKKQRNPEPDDTFE
jgi:hypothetical protein